MYCKTCGAEMNDNQVLCLKCGCAVGSGKDYCANCGSELTDGNFACMKCGVAADYNPGHKDCTQPVTLVVSPIVNSKDEAYKQLQKMEKNASSIWLVIGIVQVLSVVGILCGIWNIINALSRKKYANSLIGSSIPVYKKYEESDKNLLIFAVFNFIIGAIIGVFGVGYDFYIRSFVMCNKKYFD